MFEAGDLAGPLPACAGTALHEGDRYQSGSAVSNTDPQFVGGDPTLTYAGWWIPGRPPIEHCPSWPGSILQVDERLEKGFHVLCRTSAALALVLCGACEIAWPGSADREVAPAVLLVRPPAEAPALPPLLMASPAAPADGSEARPFPSLAAALERAPSGALLQVGEGTFRERLVIARPVVLMGRGAGKTRIVPPDGSEAAIEVRGADHVQLYGLSVEGAAVGVRITGGSGHRLENVELRGQSESALLTRDADVSVVTSTVTDVAGGKDGRGLDVTGGSLEVRRLTMRAAGRRAIFLKGARAVLQGLDVRGSLVAAVQALDGSEVRIVGGEFDGQGGAALFAAAARLSVEGAHVRHDEYAVIAARGAQLDVIGCELTDYSVAGVAFVAAHGSVQRTTIARGGTEAGISITMADGKTPVLLLDNGIQDPGTMGVHVTNSTVTARGNTITGARTDREKDMGDGFFAIESRLVLEGNVMRGNAGSGVATLRSNLRIERNSFIGNGRSGVLLLDQSRAAATSNFFQRNAFAAVEVVERAHARLVKNQFQGNPRLDIDTGCSAGKGSADVGEGNTFAVPVRLRACIE